MQTIEFEAQLNEGIIHLPLAYRHWHEGQKVKIIVVSDDDENQTDTTDNQNALSCLDMIRADVGVVSGPDDLSTNADYLKGYFR
jgi:hypothetical protein